MASKETQLRRELRSRAWSALGSVGELAGPIEERVISEDGLLEAIVIVRPYRQAAPEPPPANVLSLEPIQRFLPNCFLSDLERLVLAVLLALGTRRAFVHLRADVEARAGHSIGEGPLKTVLARMTDPEVGILDNDRKASPPGYQITAAYRAFLDWASRIAARGAA